MLVLAAGKHTVYFAGGIMRTALLTVCSFASLAILAQAAGQPAQADRDVLQGVWVAQSAEREGKPAPLEETKQLRFTFRGDQLLVRGNFKDDREEECAFTIDPSSSPRRLDMDITPPKQNQPRPGIYEVKGDELKVCLRISGPQEPPSAFGTKPGSGLILVVFKKQKPYALTGVRSRLDPC